MAFTRLQTKAKREVLVKHVENMWTSFWLTTWGRAILFLRKRVTNVISGRQWRATWRDISRSITRILKKVRHAHIVDEWLNIFKIIWRGPIVEENPKIWSPRLLVLNVERCWFQKTRWHDTWNRCTTRSETSSAMSVITTPTAVETWDCTSRHSTTNHPSQYQTSISCRHCIDSTIVRYLKNLRIMFPCLCLTIYLPKVTYFFCCMTKYFSFFVRIFLFCIRTT